MAAGVNYWSSDEPADKVRECVWGEQGWSSEDGGGGVTWGTQAMEVKGQLISAPDPLTCADRKGRERMAELQERRRSLQVLLSTRLAELRRICLQEAELTGAVPPDFPLEDGERPPCVRRRGGAARQTRKSRPEDEDSQRSKPRKTLFSAALRKHSDSEHNTHTQTHTHHGKRTVHRGCHTDDTVRSESSSASDSTGQDHDDSVSQCLLLSAVSPVEIFYPNKSRKNSVHNRADHPETPHLLPPPPSHPLLALLPPTRSQGSSSSSGPSDAGPAGEEGVQVNAARHSNSSDGLLEEEGPARRGGLWVNAPPASRGAAAAGRGRGGGYSEVLLDYVWGKQLQRQQSQPSRQPITSQHQLLYNGRPPQPPPGAPPTSGGPVADQRRVKVTRTKSCGPFLPVSPSDTHNPPLSTIQPDPHPHLLPPRPPQLPPAQDAQLEEATRSLHKALALEGLRDWYLRNTIGSALHSQAGSGGGGGQAAGGGALQGRRRTHAVIQQSTYQVETSRHKQTLPHSATFHGHPLHGRSVDGPPPQKQDQPSPGTLV